MKYVLINRTQRPFIGTLTVSEPVRGPAGINIHDLERGLRDEGLSQFPWNRNETPGQKMARGVQRRERAKVACYLGERYQAGGFDEFVELSVRDRAALLDTIEEVKSWGVWNRRKVVRPLIMSIRSVSFERLAWNTRTLPGFRHPSGQVRKDRLYELDPTPFPFRDALRAAADGANFAVAVGKWADALAFGVKKANSEGNRNAVHRVSEADLMRPSLIARLEGEGELMMAPEIALLRLLQETPTALGQQTVNDRDRTENGDQDGRVPPDLDLPLLRRDISFDVPKRRIEEVTRLEMARGLKRSEARISARARASREHERFLRTLPDQIVGAGVIVEGLRKEVVSLIERTTRDKEFWFIPELAVKAMVTHPRALKAPAQDVVDRWAAQADPATWRAAMNTYAGALNALEQAQEDLSRGTLKAMPDVFQQYRSVAITEEVTTLAGAKLLLEQHHLPALAYWVEQQERLVDRRVIYGDPFAPDFTEVATVTRQTVRTHVHPDIEAYVRANQGYTMTLGHRLSEVPANKHAAYLRALNTLHATDVAQSDFPCATGAYFDIGSANELVTMVSATRKERAEKTDFRTVTELDVAYLIAHAREVRLNLAHGTKRTYFNGQVLHVDARHAALLAAAASMQDAGHQTEILLSIM